jgi:methylated-DNA-[protein]-cysteine S-methyltransferase
MASLVVDSPIGPLTLYEKDGRLTRLRWAAQRTEGGARVLALAAEQLAAYFAGRLSQFEIALEPADSSFRQLYRETLMATKPAQRLTYGQLAARMGYAPREAARAVGTACATNPLPIIVPCHRVVVASGQDHYSGPNGADDLKTKSWLLLHEVKMTS